MSSDKDILQFQRYVKVAKAWFDAQGVEVSDGMIGRLAILLKDVENDNIPKWLDTFSDHNQITYKEE